MSRLLRLLFPAFILGVGIFAYTRLSEEQPPELQTRPARELPVVTVRPLERVDYQVLLKTQGIVRPHDSGSLTAQIPGRVEKIHPGFETGAFFKKGEPLVELERADLETALIAANARIARAQSTLTQEIARGEQARLNWQDLGYDTEPSDLVLRKPQLAQAEADLAAARADLASAERNLERATVVAPYNGRVARREVSVGQTIGGQTSLGEIFSTDSAELRLPLDRRQLDFVHLPEEQGDEPLHVVLTDERRDETFSRDAQIVRTEGQLDESSRELFVIARIDDPFGLQNGLPPLRMGQPVRASIAAATLEDVFVFSREDLRSLSEVVLVETDEEGEERLRRTPIEPLWTEEKTLVVREGFEEGDRLVVGSLNSPVNGGRVTTELEVIEPEVSDPIRAAAPEKDATPGA